ncbi:superoxide dismutase [Mn/Fe]-like [Ptychodera flava]|uniref:superoxide dismutase [Mn/Fe]-like n=1 Tax=Ptychodera flava TaxID=63121 RepID=UPI003969BDE5
MCTVQILLATTVTYFAAFIPVVIANAPLPYEIIATYASSYELPTLPYDYGDLEPYIDEATVRVHHQGHHAGYTQKMNAALSTWRSKVESQDPLAAEPIFVILQKLDQVSEIYRSYLRNFGGGYVNHNLYWSVMSPNKENMTRTPKGSLLKVIKRDFGSFSNFKEAFSTQANVLFGSGYVWLCLQLGSEKEELIITTSANQDSPLSDGQFPILVIDVWEHAYYLKHKNLRKDHVKYWWYLVDWDRVQELREWWKKLINYENHDEL